MKYGKDGKSRVDFLLTLQPESAAAPSTVAAAAQAVAASAQAAATVAAAAGPSHKRPAEEAAPKQNKSRKKKATTNSNVTEDAALLQQGSVSHDAEHVDAAGVAAKVGSGNPFASFGCGVSSVGVGVSVAVKESGSGSGGGKEGSKSRKAKGSGKSGGDRTEVSQQLMYVEVKNVTLISTALDAHLAEAAALKSAKPEGKRKKGSKAGLDVLEPVAAQVPATEVVQGAAAAAGPVALFPDTVRSLW